jgi:hypothetical protein
MTEMASNDFTTIWRALRKARVKGASYSIFFTDDGTLGGSCGIQPIYNSGDTWSRNFGKVRTETAQAVQELSNALWDLHFPECMGLEDGIADAEWIVAGDDGQPCIEISYLDNDGNEPYGGGKIMLDQDGNPLAREERAHHG